MSRLPVVVVCFLVAACGTSSESTGGSGGIAGSGGSGGAGGAGGSGGTGGMDCQPPTLASLSQLTPGQPNELKPGCATSCARGDPYSFFVWPGATDKVVVDFMGGGACWNAATCVKGSPFFDDTVDKNVGERIRTGQIAGFFDMANPANPAHDYTHVLVTYCTGDIHWGSATVQYGTGDTALTIHHAGADNSRAALSWVYDNFPSPSKVFVTGCSAGAYGALLWAAQVRHHYGSNVDVQHLSDSGAGIITPDFRKMNFPTWNVNTALPDFIPALDPAHVDITNLELTDMYIAIGQAFPEMRLAQWNSINDTIQPLFYLLMGGTGSWSSNMQATMQTLHSALPSFRSWVDDASQHCVLPDADFYSLTTQNTKANEWVGKLMNDQDPGNVACDTCGK